MPVERIESRILVLRGHRVIMDVDLAELYGVEAKRLNEQVKRNIERFPEDFMFQLTPEEFSNLKSHFATSSSGWGGKRKLPYVFTEHGAIMAANVLNSQRAIEASVYVVRAFVRLRNLLATNKKLMYKLSELEKRLDSHDETIQALITAIRELMEPLSSEPKNRIGFKTHPKLTKIK